MGGRVRLEGDVKTSGSVHPEESQETVPKDNSVSETFRTRETDLTRKRRGVQLGRTRKSSVGISVSESLWKGPEG